ncbi:hypothetical protein JCM8547_002444 [Rhodosporidiobolus lusitaniae]
MPSLHDTRLLSNLLKTEKDAMQAFKHYTLTASSAGAALSAWSVADSGDTGDIMDAALRISQLLSTCTDAQRSYLHALSIYRASLKDVLARETALRTVVRDREILVNRLIKIGNKRPKDTGVEEHVRKVEEAQTELRACETYLQEEESALAHAKRRSFRDALASRMRSMGELARVMEESANQAVEVLESLGSGPEFSEADFKHVHQYEIGSDAGDSIAPSQSASQAMSRASSSSSLDDEFKHQNSPPLPADFAIPSAASRNRTRSLSPAPRANGAASPIRTSRPPPSSAAVPIMAPVPSAPPPLSSKVYTERVAGMPTFDIPRAPDLSRRPEDSDSSSDDDSHRGAAPSGVNGLPPTQRSSHYPRDPPRGAFSEVQSNRLRRKAMSDTSSYDGEGGGGRKRRGSFLGGIAALFSRNKGNKAERRQERLYASEGYGGSSAAGGGGDYGTARSRLASSAGGQGDVHDAVRRSVMNAGLRPAAASRHAADSSDDDDTPRNTVRHVNDPKQRIKALSDVGRGTRSPSEPLRPVKDGKGEKRPALTRKGTDRSRASTVRPLSMATTVGAGGEGGEPKKVKRKVKKAASDIGMATGWNSTAAPPPPSAPELVVPRAPVTNGLAPLAGPPPLPTSTSTATSHSNYATPSGTATPHAVETGGTGTPTETGSIKKKKKSSKTVSSAHPGQHEQTTVVLSAEALGIPTSASTTPSNGPNGGGLTRSGTVKSTATDGTAKTKKKRSALVSAPPLPVEHQHHQQLQQPSHLPTAEDLANSLPTARPSNSTFTAQLPRPDDDPYARNSKISQTSSTAATAAPVVVEQQEKGTKKTLVDKKSQRMSALHGVGEGNWVSNPNPPPATSSPSNPITAVSAPAPSPPSPQKPFVPAFVVKARQRNNVHEGDESLLSVVDRAEGNDNSQPSRTYGNNTASTTSTTSSSLAPPIAVSAANGDGATTPTLAKRKSVRLGDATDAVARAGATLTPSGSIRSASSGTATRGILVQRDPSPAPGFAAASLDAPTSGGWPTRDSMRRMMDDDSSDDEGGGGGYWAARKMLGRGTREMESVMSGKIEGKGKGKARAD